MQLHECLFNAVGEFFTAHENIGCILRLYANNESKEMESFRIALNMILRE
jgi:hypothetical protein